MKALPLLTPLEQPPIPSPCLVACLGLARGVDALLQLQEKAESSVPGARDGFGSICWPTPAWAGLAGVQLSAARAPDSPVSSSLPTQHPRDRWAALEAPP